METSTTSPQSAITPGLMLLAFPTEIHFQIASYLSYPDALALKHTSRHFYGAVNTNVRLKVQWLVERFERKLECPMEKCSFRTDEDFCNKQVRRIMEKRRRHLECRPIPGGCWVVEGQSCRASVVLSWYARDRGQEIVFKRSRLWMRQAVVLDLFVVVIKILWMIFIWVFFDVLTHTLDLWPGLAEWVPYLNG